MVLATQLRRRCTVCSPMVVSLLRATVISVVLMALSATSALAQIYVVTEAAGSRRFTSGPVPGMRAPACPGRYCSASRRTL